MIFKHGQEIVFLVMIITGNTLVTRYSMGMIYLFVKNLMIEIHEEKEREGAAETSERTGLHNTNSNHIISHEYSMYEK